jgi:hypothetical protein
MLEHEDEKEDENKEEKDVNDFFGKGVLLILLSLNNNKITSSRC